MKTFLYVILGLVIGMALNILTMPDAEAHPSVLKVISIGGGGGTGFIVKGKSGKNYIATAYHVCGTDRAMAIQENGKQSTKLERVVAVFPAVDLCVLSYTGKAKPFTVLPHPQEGDKIHSCGYGGKVFQGLVHRCIKGTVQGRMLLPLTYKGPCVATDTPSKDPKEPCGRTIPTVLADNKVVPGDSGGPLLDTKNRVVGIVYLAIVGQGSGSVGPEFLTMMLNKL